MHLSILPKNADFISHYIHASSDVSLMFVKFIINGTQLLSVHLHIVHVCFYSTMSELSSCDRNHLDQKAWNIYYLALQRKSLSNLDLEDWFSVFNFCKCGHLETSLLSVCNTHYKKYY